jgi:hypothetical protein
LSSTQLKHDPRAFSGVYFSVAKRWWGVSLICRAGIILVAAIGVWVPGLSKVVSVVMVALSIASEGIIYHSDRTKGIAEWLLRKLDLRDSFGWDISRAEMSDVLARTSERIRADVRPESEVDVYFASKDQHGPARALKNIQESAWWSKHLAATMGWYVLVFMLVAVFVSLFALLFTLSAMSDPDALSSIGRSVTSVLMVVLSLGLLRLTIGYFGFKEKAERAERRAAELLKEGGNETEAIKLYAEYHLDRAAAPLVPDSVYRWNRRKLNELWDEYRTD